MRKPILALVMFTFLLVGCSDDPLSESIVGTWELQSIESSGCDDPTANQTLTTVDGNDCLEFRGDVVCNVFFVFSADLTVVENYTEDGDADSDEYTYTTNDDNDTVTICEVSSDCEIIRVDGDNMTRTIIDDGCTTLVRYKKA